MPELSRRALLSVLGGLLLGVGLVGCGGSTGSSNLSRPRLYVVGRSANTVNRAGLTAGSETFGTFGSAIPSPVGIAVRTDETIFVGSQTGNAIFSLDAAGTPVKFANVAEPWGMTFDASDRLYVVSRTNGTVLRFAADGTSTVVATGLSGPTGIALDSSGTLFVCDHDKGRIVKVNADGTLTEVKSGLTDPSGIAVRTNGVIYVSSASGKKVQKLATDGTLTDFATGFLEPNGLVLDADGNLYVADTLASTVTRYNEAGSGTTFLSALNNPIALAVR